MKLQLIERDIEKSCQRMLAINNNEHNCSGFIRAVADDLMLFVPGASGVANAQIDFMRLVSTVPGIFVFLGKGQVAESRAVTAAMQKAFVICGATSDEVQTNRKDIVKYGHVAIVVGGWGATGWPLAWWGQKGGTAGRRESLSKCFRASDRALISYFAYIATGL